MDCRQKPDGPQPVFENTLPNVVLGAILTAESWKGLDYRRSVYRRTFADLQTPRRMMDCFNCFTYDQA